MPTLTKNDIVNEISNKVGFKKKDSVDLIEKLLEIIKRTLEKLQLNYEISKLHSQVAA